MKTGRITKLVLLVSVLCMPMISLAGTPLDSTCVAVCPDDSTKIQICHIPMGKPGNAHEICIDPADISGHARHGDLCGPCDSTIVDTTSHGKAPGPHGVATGYSNNRDSTAWINIVKNHSSKMSSTGVNAIETQMMVSPNPFRGTAQVKINAVSDNISVILYDIAGKQHSVLFQGASNGAMNLELSSDELDAGIYFIRIVSGNESVNQKIVVLK